MRNTGAQFDFVVLADAYLHIQARITPRIQTAGSPLSNYFAVLPNIGYDTQKWYLLLLAGNDR